MLTQNKTKYLVRLVYVCKLPVMKKRIQEIITQEQLSASDFANKIGVQRSSVSHILSGRNNPSLEVVQKILTAFSTLNSEWLLFGRGAMYKDATGKDLFSESTSIYKEKQKIERKNDTPTKKSSIEVLPDTEIIEKNSSKSKTEKVENSYNIGKAERIIIFNSDKTFVEYKPS